MELYDRDISGLNPKYRRYYQGRRLSDFGTTMGVEKID
jgi:hypothetical protein